MTKLEKLQGELGGRVVTNELMAKHTTFRIGGPAKYFFAAKTRDEVIKSVKAARGFKIPVFVLGVGSNVLFSDKGFNGLIIHVQNMEWRVEGQTIEVGAGMPLAKVAVIAWEYGLTGMEFAATIPGSVGGAVRGNAGAYRKSLADIVDSVEFLENGRVKVIRGDELMFGYRESRFKHFPAVILSVVLKLRRGDSEASRQEVAALMAQRQKTQPLEYGSAGCTFKNLLISPPVLSKIGRLIPQEFKDREALPAAWVVDKILGMKGRQVGQARISEKHANFIVNLSNATAKDVMALIKMVKRKAKALTGVELEEEVELVGFGRCRES